MGNKTIVIYLFGLVKLYFIMRIVAYVFWFKSVREFPDVIGFGSLTRIEGNFTLPCLNYEIFYNCSKHSSLALIFFKSFQRDCDCFTSEPENAFYLQFSVKTGFLPSATGLVFKLFVVYYLGVVRKNWCLRS